MSKKAKTYKLPHIKNNKLLYGALLWQILWIAAAIVFEFKTAGNPMLAPLSIGAIGYAFARTSSFNLKKPALKMLSIIILTAVALGVSYYIYFLLAGLLT